MWAASKDKGGVGGVSQKVGREFVAADKPGKLPEKAKKTEAEKASALYRK